MEQTTQIRPDFNNFVVTDTFPVLDSNMNIGNEEWVSVT